MNSHFVRQCFIDGIVLEVKDIATLTSVIILSYSIYLSFIYLLRQ
jgi:hypothetical protein